MKKFLIKREIPGVSKTPSNDLDKGAKESEKALIEMREEGKEIQQEQSYVLNDAIYCIYNAASEDLIKEHAERSGGAASEIIEISGIIKHNTSTIS